MNTTLPTEPAAIRQRRQQHAHMIKVLGWAIDAKAHDPNCASLYIGLRSGPCDCWLLFAREAVAGSGA